MHRISVPLLACAAACGAALGGCTSMVSSNTEAFLGVITPYRIDIVQGNVVTKEQMAQLKTGMTRNQVRDVIGSPLVTDAFHNDRWDYIFTIRRPGTPPQRRSIVITFEGEGVKSIDAPELPSEHDFVASISKRQEVKIPRLELNDAERLALPAPVRPPETPAPAEPAGALRDYPPLDG